MKLTGAMLGGAADQRVKEGMLKIQQNQLEYQQKADIAKQAQTNANNILDSFEKGVTSISDDQREPLTQHFATALKSSIDTYQALGLDPTPLVARFQSIQTAPTKAEQLKQKSTEERTVSQARAEGTAAGTPANVSNEVEAIAKLSAGLLKDNVEPSVIATVIQSMSSPGTEGAVSAIIAGLPPTRGDFQRQLTEESIAAAQPKINALVASGVPRDVASMIVLGGRGSLVNIDASGGKFSPAEMKELRMELREKENAVTALNAIKQSIVPGSVGIMGMLNENVGGVVQQVPGVNGVFNALGVFSKDQVSDVKAARGVFRTMMGTLARYITQKGRALSNEDIVRVTKATGMLDVTTSEDDAKAIIETIVRLAEEAIKEDRATLERGSISAAPTQTNNVVLEGGDFVVRDSSGKEINRFKAK